MKTRTSHLLGPAGWLVLLLACWGEPPAVLRFVEEDAAELLTDERLYSTATVFEWTCDGPEDLAEWVPVDIEMPLLHPEPRGLIFQTAAGVAVLERPLALDAGAVHAVEVTLGYPHPAALGLSWSRAGEPRRERPWLALRPDDGVVGKGRTYTFDLRAAAEWTGEVTALRFRFADVGGGHRVVTRIRGLRYGLSPDELAERARRPWKVDLGHDVRNALLAPPGVAIARRFRAVSGSVLRFAYGTTGELGAPVRFRVVAERGGGSETLFESTLAAGQGHRWHEAEVDLSGAAGASRLALETAADEPLDPVRGLPVWGHPEIVPPAAARGDAGAAPSVLLISIDTLRPDHLSLYGYGEPTSPRLDAWARRHAAVFEEAVAQAPWTLPSHVSMLTGLGAPRHGVNYSRASAPASLTTLGERLRAAGWATAAVTGGGWFHPRFGLQQGFDRYRYWPARDRDRELDEGVEAALAHLAGLRRPFFLFFHTFAVHDFRARPGEAPEDDRRRYDRRIAITDARLGRLFEAVESAGLRGQLAIVFTSDHGESFGGERPPGHGYLFEDNLLVPLAVELPDGRGAGARVAGQVRSIDVVPTILDAAGVSGADDLDGTSLLPSIDGGGAPPPLAASYAAEGNHGLALRLGGRWKYTFDNAAWPEHRGREALYDLDSDPGERRDLGPGDPRLPALRAAARDVLAATPGVVLRFANASAAPLTFTILAPGTVIGKYAVKSVDLPCDCVTLDGIGEMTVTVPPATRFEVVLEHWDADRLEIRASLGDRPPSSGHQILLAGLGRPAVLRWSGSSWTLAQPAAELDTGVEIERRGDPRPGPPPADLDAELRRSLRALGYLD